MYTRTKKATINIISNILYELTAFICGLILPRLILSNFGSTYNGITSSINQFLSLIAVLRLGIAGATRVALYKTIANNDIEGTSSIIKATEIYMRKIGIAILIYIIIMAIFYPMFINVELPFIDIAVLVIAAGVGTFAQYFFGITYTTFLTADQSIYIYNFIQTLATIGNTLISVILIKFGFSIQTVKLASALIFFITPIFINYYVSKKYKLIKKCLPDNSAIQKKSDAMGHSIANMIHDNTDIVVLTIFCDIKIVSVYSIYNLIMTALKKIQDIFSTGTESIFGNMWAKGEKDKISNNLSLYEYIISILTITVTSCTIILILPFVSLYTKNIKDINYILPTYALIITIAQAFYCLRTPYLTLVQGIGNYKETKKAAYLEAILNISISVILVFPLGIIGTAIGTLFANIYRTFNYAFYIDKNIIIRGKKVIFKRIIWIFSNILIISIFGFKIISCYAYLNWIYWIVCAIIMTLITLSISLVSSFFFFRKDVFRTLNVIKRIFKKE